MAGLQGPCLDTQCQPLSLELVLPVTGWQSARLICQYMGLFSPVNWFFQSPSR